MTKNILIKCIVELEELEKQFGSVSCLDFPNEYNKMEELANNIYSEINKITKLNNISKNHNGEIIQKLCDYINEYDEELFSFNIYNLDEYIEDHILDNMETESEKGTFYSFYKFVNEDIRKNYIKSIFLDGEQNRLYNDYLGFIVVIDTES